MNAPAKVALVREKPHWHAPGHKTLPITFALPYFQAAPGRYVHRIKSGGVHLRDGKLSHRHFHFWCDGAGFLDTPKRAQSRIMSEVPHGEVLCATCEGRAIGAGMDGSRKINGRMVRFSPRL